MQRRKIGGLDVSVVGLGCNNFGWRVDETRSRQVIDAAIDAGIDFFDTADVYGERGKSEEFLGRALRGRREQVVIASKFGHRMGEGRSGASPAWIRQAVEDSLHRLGTDRIDLYQLHKPDPAVPIAETLGALGDLVREGKVREIGCSNFSAEQLRDASEAAEPGSARFVSVQNEYSILHREPENGVLAECRRQQIALLPYYPLASGLLTGKYRRGRSVPEGTRIAELDRYKSLPNEENLEVVERLVAFAESRGRTLLELAFSWLLAHGEVASVIAGATSAEQVQANVRAAGWPLTAAEMAEVDRLCA